MTIKEVLERVVAFNPRYVCITGGEPLAQLGSHPLLTALCNLGYEVSLETSGALDIGAVDPRVSIVMDLKTPGSGESERNLYDNIDLLARKDQVKFVIGSRRDYEWSRAQVREYRLDTRCEVLFSPSYEEIDARSLADWILEDRLRVRMQMQIHKLLWNNAAGH